MGLRGVDSQEERAQPCLQEKLCHTAQGPKEVWSLSDTAVEMQIQWGEKYSQQQQFLLFQESRECLEGEVTLEKAHNYFSTLGKLS